MEPLDYKSAGVDYGRIDPLKILAQRAAAATAGNLARHGMTEVGASRGESAYVVDCGEFYLASITECLGTKALVADAMRAITGRTYYDGIAQDTLAMAINDLITVGATPVSVHAYWATGGSDWFDDAARAHDLVAGWQAACDACGVAWGGGETPALAGVVMPGRIDLAASCVGLVRPRSRLTLGERLAAGDAIVLLESSGIHANGLSLARQLATRLPEGFATRMPVAPHTGAPESASDGPPDPAPDATRYGEALLAPTLLYAPVTERLAAAGIVPHYCVNVTGHGWRKLMRHPGAFTYRIHTLPPVPPVLRFLQEQARIDDREAYGNLNMGAGFALFVAPGQAAQAVELAAALGMRAWDAGRVERGPRRVDIEPLGLVFDGDDLHVRA
jgi:phosphoribosylformylglycinamidine cyclo-ligase